jgi:hypothetical protein
LIQKANSGIQGFENLIIFLIAHHDALHDQLSPEIIAKEEIVSSKEEKVICETPTPGKKPTRIDKWKYNLVRTAILAVVPSDDQGVEFSKLPQLVEGQISTDDLERLGSVSWYTTTGKLDLEVKGVIERVPGSKPQSLRIVS